MKSATPHYTQENRQPQGISQFELSKSIYTSGLLTKVKMKNTTKLVLMALANHYNAQNAEMFPSQRYLANQLGISEKSVERAIYELSTLKLIIYITKTVNHYKFTNYFFELVKMSENSRQFDVPPHRQNVGQTYNMKQINKKEFFKPSFKAEVPSARVPSAEETQALLERYRKEAESASSPLDFGYDDAVKWLNKLPKLVENSFMARKMREKHGLRLENGINIRIQGLNTCLTLRS